MEVPLELLRIQDSAAMLMEIGQVDEAEYLAHNPGTDFPPQAALRIASECGNLPLMLTLAGKMIRQWGSLWADIDGGKGVLSVLQKDNMGLMRKRANSAKQFSHTLSEKIGSTLEQRIISAGLNSIRSDDAEFVKDGESFDHSALSPSLALPRASFLLPRGHGRGSDARLVGDRAALDELWRSRAG